MTLHYNAEETSGVVTSLKPIGKANYPFLQKAVNGRLNSDSTPNNSSKSSSKSKT